jgi:4-amino-4-deoxy-L-arabinose transferase-like glycosyltransferase
MRERPWGLLLLGLVLYLALQVMCIGVPIISGSSEAREAQVVDVILREGSWVLPLRNGVIPSKPPLFHWFAALISMVLGGVSEFSVRIASQLAAAVCIALVAAAAYRLASLLRTFQGSVHPRRAALLAAGVLSLTYGFYIMGCQAMVDMTFTVCVWASLVSLLYGIKRADEGIEKANIHPFGRALFWLFACVGVLARGPLGLLLPLALATTAGFIVVGIKRTVALICTPTIGWLAFAIPVLWYLCAYSVGGEAFLERQILFENLKRFSGGEFVNSEAWWFYVPSLLRTTFPWGLILLWIVTVESRRGRSLSYPNERALYRWTPVLLLGVGVFLFSLSSGKRHSYLLPLLPLVALQLGIEISSLLERGGVGVRQRLLRAARNVEVTLGSVAIVTFAGLSLSVASGLVSSNYFQDAYGAASHVLARMGGIILGISLVSFVVIRRSLNSVCASAWLMMLVLMTTVVAAGSSVKGYFKGFDVMSSTWLETIGQGDELAVLKHPFDEYFDPMLFYVRRPVRLIALESAPHECRSATVYATRRVWLDAHEQLFSGSIVRVATVRERGSAYKGRADRDVVFFRCSTLGGQAEHAKPLLQDAGFTAPGLEQKRPAAVPNEG